MGTTNCIDAYDTRADRWVDITQEEQSNLAGHGTVYHNGFVYCIGGFDGQHFINSVRRYDPITREWQQMAPMHWHRCNVSVVVLDGFIYTMGGHIVFRPLNKVERYNPVTNEWTQIEPMNERRSDASATTLNGKIYICGGHSGTESLSTVECFDPLTNEWSLITPMSTPRHSLGVTAYKGKIYAVRGMPPQQAPTTLRPQLQSAASTTEAWNKAHSDSMSPASSRTWEKLCWRSELNLLLTLHT
ncbi:kelch-like protein 10 isoform X1 [Brienomyrus brachyistius]|uniref:kelch-like protein 10 isoform X1 n=1 Tax=Brienomyrus brachyistius TaxID=42636 RepID=UPI0020B3C146|nr:kelch-like protein 10 isoform X1 [Brienomyrus brachyistius]